MCHSPGAYFLFLHHLVTAHIITAAISKAYSWTASSGHHSLSPLLYKGTFAIWFRHQQWWETATATHSFSVAGVIQGYRYHVYQRIWMPILWEKKPQKSQKPQKFHLEAVLEDETLCTVGHLPQEMSKECWCWLHVGLPTNWK